MNLKNYYYYFTSALPIKTCEDILDYGKSQQLEMAVTGEVQSNIDKKQKFTKKDIKNVQKKRKSDVDTKLKIEEDSLPKLQKSLSLFPDFEQQFPTTVEINLESNTESASDILLRIAQDFQKLALIIK